MKNKIKVIFEDEDLLAIDKPAGILSEGKNSVVSWFKDTFTPQIKKLKWPDNERLGLVHRLDRDTSGVLLIAKNPETLSNLQNQFKKRKVQKVYSALVYGKLKQSKGELLSFIGKNKPKARQKSWLINWEEVTREAKTAYKVEKVGRLEIAVFQEKIEVSFLRLTPLTGRTHQIRAQLKQIGTPIVGDNLYSTKLSRKINKALGLKRHFLHAQSLTFIKPDKKKLLTVKAELPKDLQEILNKIKWHLRFNKEIYPERSEGG